MIIRFFYLLIIIVFLLPVAGFLLNSKELSPTQFYKSLIGERDFFKVDPRVKQSLSKQGKAIKQLQEREKDNERLTRIQQQDQKFKLDKMRQEQIDRQRQALDRNQLGQTQDLLRQQQERTRDFKNRYQDLMATRRSVR